MNTKIGVGIVTYNRENVFKQCVNSIPNVDTLIVVNDGEPYSQDAYPKSVKEVFQHTKNKSVGVSKNEILRYLVQDNCQFIFTIEDDVYIKNPNVFLEYIRTGEVFGTWHLNYACTIRNKDISTNELIIKRIIEDEKTNRELYLYQNCTGQFSFYVRAIIKEIGYMDEHFFNAMEHVEYTYRMIKKGLHPPFWWFADIAKSWEYIGDNKTESVISKDTEKAKKNFIEACNWFKHLHGYIPMEIPQTSESEVISVLDTIQKNYAKKIIS